MELFTSFAIALGVGAVLGHLLIPVLSRLKFGQTVRHDGPQTHYVKSGTPTMGGWVIWGAISVALLVNGSLLTFAPFLVVILGHALLGYIDDYIKAVHKDPEGLAGSWKLLGQVVLALFFALVYMLGTELNSVFLPLIGQHLPLGSLYPVFIVCYMVFFSNAVNFADGVDSLCGGLTIIFCALCLVVALQLGHPDIALFAATLIGGIAAFLLYNRHPARLFMGDTGSLGLGAALAGMALLLRQEIALLVAGSVFVVEVLSVTIQKLYFKYTRRKYGEGRRFFRMAPIHHHFEVLGWSEQRVVQTFWLAALVSALLGYLLIRY